MAGWDTWNASSLICWSKGTSSSVWAPDRGLGSASSTCFACFFVAASCSASVSDGAREPPAYQKQPRQATETHITSWRHNATVQSVRINHLVLPPSAHRLHLHLQRPAGAAAGVGVVGAPQELALAPQSAQGPPPPPAPPGSPALPAQLAAAPPAATSGQPPPLCPGEECVCVALPVRYPLCWCWYGVSYREQRVS